MPSITLALLGIAAAAIPASAGSLSWDLSGLITCTDLDSTRTNRDSACGMGVRITHGGFDFETNPPGTGGWIYEANADVVNDVSLSPTGMFGKIGYFPVDRLTMTFRFASPVDYESAFFVPITADMSYEGQSFHDVATGLTGTLSYVPSSSATSTPVTTIQNPEPRTTLLMACIAIAVALRGRKALVNHHSS